MPNMALRLRIYDRALFLTEAGRSSAASDKVPSPDKVLGYIVGAPAI